MARGREWFRARNTQLANGSWLLGTPTSVLIEAFIIYHLDCRSNLLYSFSFCSILFFGFGWLFFMRQLFKDYEVRQYVVQVIFSVTFAFSCTMFELIIFEILKVLNSRNVTDADILALERRLLQTMDMIISKKKRMAMTRRTMFQKGEATINIVFDRVGKTDPVTRGIEITVNYLGIQFDVKFWSQHISFILVGIIIVTSIRGLLITLTKFFYAISSSKSSNVIVLLLAQIMGMYFVSSVLLIRMSMPLEYRTIITEVLGELQFNFYHRWFDVIFLVSALSSILFLYLAHKQAPEKHMAP
ncbi:hypothetical protein GH733_018470 [Mirounga leonina]|nr:hypothetical protein GH733_018470 [Mirounga leonina]